jgi:hypothetical protein
MQSRLRILDDILDETASDVEPADVVRFLMSIYEAKRFKVSNKQNSNYLLSFDIPSFDIFLLDQFTKMRFDRRLHSVNYFVINLPNELSLLTKLDVAAAIYENWIHLRFHISGQFITVKF